MLTVDKYTLKINSLYKQQQRQKKLEILATTYLGEALWPSLLSLLHKFIYRVKATIMGRLVL